MKSAQEKFQELQKKSQSIIQNAVQINTKIETARENYEKLAVLAKEKYGTDDLEELKTLLTSWEEDNMKKITAYEEEIAKLEKEVQEKNTKIKELQQEAQNS